MVEENDRLRKALLRRAGWRSFGLKILAHWTLCHGCCRIVSDQVEKPLEVVTEAHQVPFGFHFGQSSQVKTAESEHFFDDPKNWFDRLFGFVVNLPAFRLLCSTATLPVPKAAVTASLPSFTYFLK